MANTDTSIEKAAVYKFSAEDGQFKRQISQFRSFVSADSTAEFPAESGRYVLYINYGCPWAHRVNLVRSLKGLENVIQLVAMDHILTPNGWTYTGRDGTESQDPLHGFKYLRDLYLKADPNYNARFTVPVLWDKKKSTIVNNESSEIIRMLYFAFDAFVEPHLREQSRPGSGLYPVHLRQDIDAMNDWVYNTVNNGVYKAGFAGTQAAYDANIYPLFTSLDRLEEHLADRAHQPYLFGPHITEADVRLFVTLIRFDIAYYTIFKRNLKMIRHDYPRLHLWLRRLYWDEGPETNGGAFKNTTWFKPIKEGYAASIKSNITPAGPVPNIMGLDRQDLSADG
ncbi:glutathione S-transferase [Lipomyces starkeyi]